MSRNDSSLLNTDAEDKQSRGTLLLGIYAYAAACIWKHGYASIHTHMSACVLVCWHPHSHCLLLYLSLHSICDFLALISLSDTRAYSPVCWGTSAHHHDCTDIITCNALMMMCQPTHQNASPLDRVRQPQRRARLSAD